MPTRDPFVLIVELDLSETCEFEFEADCLIEALRTVARDGTDGGIWNFEGPVVFLFFVDLGTFDSKEPRGMCELIVREAFVLDVAIANFFSFIDCYIGWFKI